MLTDYHVHLRPDEPGTTAELYFTTANAEQYRIAASERGIAELGVSEHVYRFEQALDVWRHPFWQANAREDLDAYCEFVRTQTDLGWGSRRTSCQAPRTAWQACWRRATSIT